MAFKDKQTRYKHWVSQHSPIDHPERTEHKCTECNEGFPTSSRCNEHRLHKCVPKDDPGLAALRDRVNKTQRARYAKNEMVRAQVALRGALRRMMKKHGMGKVSLSEGVVGCLYEELIAHLNDNDRGFVYEKSGGVFHIDHIRPMASFKNLKCQVEVLKCMNFNNLQLLPGPENCSKGKSFTSTQVDVSKLPYLQRRVANAITPLQLRQTTSLASRVSSSWEKDPLPLRVDTPSSGKRDVVFRLPVTFQRTHNFTLSTNTPRNPTWATPQKRQASNPWMAEWCEVLEIFSQVFHKHGDNCTEKMYQNAVAAELYKRNYACITEKKIFRSDGGFSSVEIGRIDLEVEQRLLFEFKVHNATAANIRKDKAQLGKYLRAYRDSGHTLERAAVVYFSNSEVRVVEVEMQY
ncbi:hypothetical protein T484DRAFT_1754941 [Baffinella frigidus]|nr:hypothetical protein T484DRAFT_1754941 [Cryptophyta sp. CCMP2293]